ncbi:MAG TPA: DM9 repeat-containing protein [Polyangiaceae bacterium]|nr:DM9 repeat-containing protein [Polyangiaceae bacterium]
MRFFRLPAFGLQGLLLVPALLAFGAACTPEEPPSPFKRVFRSSVEIQDHRGFLWVAHKPSQRDPDGRYEGGYDLQFKAGLGVCRLRHGGGLHPGKIFGGKCNSGYGGKEIITDEYDILVARHDALWHMSPKPGMDLDKVLVGGREADGKPLKLCVARYETGWWLFSNHRGYHPGKYVLGKCNIGYAGREVSTDNFFLLSLGSKLAPAPEAAPAKSILDAGGAKSPDAGAGDGGARDATSPRAEAAGRANADAGTSDAGRAAVDAGVAPAAAIKAQVLPRPVNCSQGEVACHCQKVSGCTLDGYCDCSP